MRRGPGGTRRLVIERTRSPLSERQGLRALRLEQWRPGVTGMLPHQAQGDSSSSTAADIVQDQARHRAIVGSLELTWPDREPRALKESGHPRTVHIGGHETVVDG